MTAAPGLGPTLPDPDFLTVQEVADYFRVSVGMVRIWIRDGHLRAGHTPGGHVRVLRSSVVALVEAGRE